MEREWIGRIRGFLGAGGNETENDEEDDWRGPLESLNGMLLFGLTAAFLFTMIQGIRPLKNSEGHEKLFGTPDPKQ
jgi:hypothetical protein